MGPSVASAGPFMGAITVTRPSSGPLGRLRASGDAHASKGLKYRVPSSGGQSTRPCQPPVSGPPRRARPRLAKVRAVDETKLAVEIATTAPKITGAGSLPTPRKTATGPETTGAS